MALKTEVVTSGVFLLGMSAGMFGSFCPSLYEVSSPKFTANSETPDLSVRRLRMGELYSSGIILTVGAALSVLHQNMLPFFVAVFICAAFVVGYEYLLNWEG